ncbi:hypothetical protein SAMN02910276_02892 [Butyrivibrio sp. Su6]|uniref:hypothetical protein n=1 Tax=Butyrivibrio sp. Su6 TaxID=1520810 RepID=UPI00089E4026|nr:hypothetical protein [Butyrivibrio sp. Su6]SEG42432.1 hypothetical protein SAMN02910276_02892 [Butyrivibrio sp. Su6]
MDFNFLAAANGITSKYLNQLSPSSASVSALTAGEDAKGKFGEEFDKAYDSLQATRALDATMRQSYASSHKDDFKQAADRLGYSIDNRVIDMLHLEITSKMDAQVNEAMNNAIDNL